MEIKHQVFISSTFKDLQKERKEVLGAILRAGCIPSGMESFIATDDEQFTVIKKAIDNSDYYVLIIGGKYGTINGKTGKSYTEMEYDYALERNLPILVFSFENIDLLQDSKKESDPEKAIKLEEFRHKAMGNRLADTWSNIDDLKYKVGTALLSAVSNDKKPGWMREKDIFEHAEYKKLLMENENLKKEIANFGEHSNDDYSYMDKQIHIKFTQDLGVMFDYIEANVLERDYSYREIFSIISGGLTSMINIEKYYDLIDNLCPGYYTDRNTHNKIKRFFVGHSIMKTENIKDKKKVDIEMIGLTDKGYSLLSMIDD